MARLIRRGEIWIVNLNPGFGREIHKKRPGLIISTDKINSSTPYVIVIPSSSIVPKIKSRDLVDVSDVKGFDKDSVLLPILIRSIDQDRLVKKIGKISQEKILEVEEALKLVLGMIEL